MNQPLQVRLWQWISSRLNTLTRLRILLLLSVMWCINRGLVVTTRSAGSGWLWITVLLAVLLGWLLGHSRLSAWKSALGGSVVGFVWLILTIGGLSAPFSLVVITFVPVLVAFLRPPHLPEFSPFLEAASSLGQSAATLMARFSLWFENMQTTSTIKDPVVEGFLWGLGMWIAAAWAGWWLRRRSQVVIALLPGTILFMVPILSAPGKDYLPWLVLLAGGWILIQALEHYASSSRRWQELKIDQVAIETNLAGSITFIVVIAMLAGGFIPGISLEKLRDVWDDLFEQEDRITEQTGGESAEGNPGGYSTSLRISAGQELPPDILMYITVEGYTPSPQAERGRIWFTGQEEIQYYWRDTTFSTYNGRSWSNYTSREESYPANALLYPEIELSSDAFKYVTQYVERMDSSDEMIYIAGELLSVDQPYTVAWRRSDEPVNAITTADSYTAVSRLPVVLISQLRQAGDHVPGSIRDRYLQLPDSLPNRVYNLALDLTVGLDNQYDRAKAIQDYLRQFPYNLEVPAPPAGDDAVDFFLFDLQQGYCSYYASAMTVLARAAGLPTRLVTGYRTGSYDYVNERFIVREENAHAWVEVYFSGVGWVEFEPTSGVPTFSRRGGSTDIVRVATPPSGSTEPSTTDLFWSVFRNTLGITSLLVVLVLLIYLLPLRDWILYLHPTEKTLRIIFQRLYRQGQRWGIPPDSSRTPFEFSRLLASRIRIPAREMIAADLQDLTRLYTRQLFSPLPLKSRDLHRAINLWIRLKRHLRQKPRRIHFMAES
jgi:transglutaminase-like putative cysteine protease